MMVSDDGRWGGERSTGKSGKKKGSEEELGMLKSLFDCH